MVSLNVFVVVVTVLVLALAGAVVLILRLRKAVKRTCAFGYELGIDLFGLHIYMGVPDREWWSRQTLVSRRTALRDLLDELSPIDHALDPAYWLYAIRVHLVWPIESWWCDKLVPWWRAKLAPWLDDKQGGTDD